MSFFKDFKEDLSQAVNELLPEEAAKNTAAMEEQAGMDLSGQVAPEPEQQPDMEADISQAVADLLSDTTAPMSEAPEPKIEIPNAFTEAQNAAVEESVSSGFMAEAAPLQTGTPVAPATAPQPEPVPEPAMAPQPSPEPVVEEHILQPVSQSAAPSSAGTVASEGSKPPVEPVFKETSFKPAPINTTSEKTTRETGVIISGMSITGDVISDGNLDVMGSIKGNIKLDGKLKVSGSIEGNSDVEELFAEAAKITGDIKSVGTVKVGAGTVIRGNVTATSGVFAGAVKGDIDITGPVVLDSTAIIMGNIKSKTIQINNGAIIEGLCSQCYAEVSPSDFFEKE
ncbi:MAG: polymer-forming cytoskeletal protein [Lachnospiraceae bacterium]|nr:polymer-forming cytoskeletal protein [Lachnospiraceae bacterium]